MNGLTTKLTVTTVKRDTLDDAFLMEAKKGKIT